MYFVFRLPYSAASLQRHRLTANLDSLLDLALLLEQAGDLDQAIECGRKVVQADPLREEAYSTLMRLYLRLGRPDDAMRQYHDLEKTLADELGAQPSHAAQAWLSETRKGATDDQGTVSPTAPTDRNAIATELLEPVGGAVSLGSPFYVVRPTDSEFATALRRNDSIVLVKGPRQGGKTSLLARGLAQARSAGARVVLTDLQQSTAEQLRSAETLFRTLAETIADQLDLEIKVSDVWDVERGWNVNFERFLRREVLLRAESHLVWGLDEIDRLFPYAYSTEVFALFRSWHNLRSLHPDGPWSRLTQAIAYATEAHLFIADLNQSPFNVGTRLAMDDFTTEQVADLNRRYGSPLADSMSLARMYAWLGGHPYLIRRTLHELSRQNLDLTTYKALAERENGPFHDHLRYLIEPIIGDPVFVATVREALHGGNCADARSFYRLRSAGVLAGEPDAAHPRCALYADYLRRSLP